MRRQSLAILVAVAVVVLSAVMSTPARSSPADDYTGPYFGADNLPPGCVRDMSPTNPANVCHHIRTDMNGLDSPQIDVLVLVPVSPTAERDLRIMRQAVGMWEGGIDYLAPQMGLDWLGDGVDFHITVDSFDPLGTSGGEFTTYPIVDPEIVVIASNPVGGFGYGFDPVDNAAGLEGAILNRPLVFTSEDRVPCHSVANPFDFEYWESLPGFDRHHDARSGTYNEDCGGAGGNICFAINGAIAPAPEVLDLGSLFWLVAHELGHCMTIGHVGDGGEGAWGVVPTSDIMAYTQDPSGLQKCLSTLDVEGVALRMSKYLDVNGDSLINADDLLEANDQVGDGFSPFQVQHPDDHLYASGTGSPRDCPQPDVATVPGAAPTDWTPVPVASPSAPTSSMASNDDADDDAKSAITEITSFDVESTLTHVEATIRLQDLWPSTTLTSPSSYSVTIDGRRFYSYVRLAVEVNPKTWDDGAAAFMPDGTSSWDLVAKTVTFRIPRTYLSSAGITAPFSASSRTHLGGSRSPVTDDRAPDGTATLGISG